MYNRHLATFIQVADCGSFLQAGEVLFISANAVTKQINLLEQHLNLKLFHRSNQGLILTESGKLIYEEAKKMIRRSGVILQQARELEGRQEYEIRVGVSLMNSSQMLLEQWTKASEQYPNVKLRIVPFEDSYPVFFDIVENLGKKIDVVACTYDSPLWQGLCNSFHLKDVPLRVCVPKGHRLASKVKLEIEDLHHERLIMTKRNVFLSEDKLRDDLEQNHPQIQIQDVDHYDFNLYNQIASGDSLLVSAECWGEVHPLLVSLPVNWDYTIPYGIVYAKNPSREVMQFIMSIGKLD